VVWKLLQDDASLMVPSALSSPFGLTSYTSTSTTLPLFFRLLPPSLPPSHFPHKTPFPLQQNHRPSPTLTSSRRVYYRGMLLRFRGRDGQFRLEVDPNDAFPSLTSRIAEHIPKDVDLSTITVSNRPQGGDARSPAELKGITFGRVGLK
jgi:hypothetical protein